LGDTISNCDVSKLGSVSSDSLDDIDIIDLGGEMLADSKAGRVGGDEYCVESVEDVGVVFGFDFLRSLSPLTRPF